MENRIVYKCKKCGWQESITKEWSDLKPKKCFGKKCKTSFLQNPESLLVIVPTEPVIKKEDNDEY